MKLSKKLFKKIGKVIVTKAISIGTGAGKSAINEAKEYAKDIETFHSSVKGSSSTGDIVIPDSLKIVGKEVLSEMADSIYKGNNVGEIKKRMLVSFITGILGIKGKYVNLIVELIVFLIS